jgi:hypothetical protein
MAELSQLYKEEKKRLQYFEYKFQRVNQNRNLLESEGNYEDPQQTERDSLGRKKMKNEIYA